ncbi:Peptidoglycan-N-acetylglucosamine deacetylase [Paraconexibacter sp. AEG42_29]|uniref:Peptidoglycan-N-acetylglucosamine deacetylase n=1 Tax=Paraconexibacter sp. AEG42_29 TaxID=2997339 RepID=A0AAU7ATR6_9ACTN
MTAGASSAAGVALTFDDGPDPRWTPAVLDALADAGAHATFFLMAPRAARHPELVRRIRDGGHAIGLHCERHVRHSELTAAALEEDTRVALGRFADVGEHPVLWRTPWGIVAEHTPAVARRHDLCLVHWTADTEDWAGHDPDAMLGRVAPDIQPGAVVLAHDGLGPGSTRDGCANTVALIAPLVALAADRGLACRALTEPAVAVRA